MVVMVALGRRIEFCRDGVRDSGSGLLCCSRQCGPQCGARQCTSPRDRCCWPARERVCLSIGAVECVTRDVNSLTNERTAAYDPACGENGRMCVAVLLTGHMRTFEKTSGALHAHLLRANSDRCDFDLIVATYVNQDANEPRLNDRSRHSTTAAENMTWERIDAVFTRRFDWWRARRYHIFREDEIGAVLPRDLKRQAPHLSRFKQPQHVAQIGRIKRSIALIQQGVIMVRDLAESRARGYDAVLRLRPDIELLRHLYVDAELLGLVRSKILVVPATYDPRGGLQIKASQLFTRPCARNASLTPTWVQDHMAIGTLGAMWIYARFYHAYLKPEIFAPHVETALAKYLAPLLPVGCLNTIRYTIRR